MTVVTPRKLLKFEVVNTIKNKKSEKPSTNLSTDGNRNLRALQCAEDATTRYPTTTTVNPTTVNPTIVISQVPFLSALLVNLNVLSIRIVISISDENSKYDFF